MKKVSEVVTGVFRPQHDYIPGTSLFPVIDIERLTKEMRLEERGREDGERDLPESDTTTWSATEAEIRHRCGEWTMRALNQARDALESYRTRQRSLSAGLEKAHLKNMADAARTDLNLRADEERSELHILQQEVKRRKQDYVDFREREKITRAPDPKRNIWEVLALILFVALIELAGNTYLFSVGNDLGLLGAVIEAVVVPVFNILVAFLLVLVGVKQLNRRALHRKLVGLVSLVLLIVFAVGFNLLVAHYREAIGAGVRDQAQYLAIENFLSAPLGLTGLASWGLFSLGMMVTGVTVIEAFRFSDPIPHYGELERRRVNAIESFNAMKREAVEDFGALFQERRDNMLDARRRLANAVKEVLGIEDRISSLQSDLTRYALHVETAGANLVERYRSANKKARTTPPPKSFSKPIWTPEDGPPTLDAQTSERVEPSELEDKEDILDKGLKELNAAYNEAVNTLPVLSVLETEAPDR